MIDASLRLSRHADRLSHAMEDATPLGVIRAPLSEDDSLVIAIKEVASPQSPDDGDVPGGKKSKIGG